MSEMDDHIIPETQESNENNAPEASIDDTGDSAALANDSQDFSPVDFESSQRSELDTSGMKSFSEDTKSTEDSKISKNQENPMEARDFATSIQEVQSTSSEVEKKKIIDQVPKSLELLSECVTNDDDEEIVNATPPAERVLPKRQLLGASMGLKRKTDGSDEVATKIARSETDQTQNNTIDGNKVAESIEVLTQELANVLGEPNFMEIEKNNAPTINSATTQIDNQLLDSKKTETMDTDSKDKLQESIELIYDKALATPSKPKELVEIDEDGEKIILDTSQEDLIKDLTDSPENQMVTNGSDDSKKSDSDKTVSLQDASLTSNSSSESKIPAVTPPSPKKMSEVLVNLVSDSEGDSFVTEEKSKIKTIPIEKDLVVVMKIKCIVHIDESTKDIVNSEFTSVHCDHTSSGGESPHENHSDVSALADISDNSKDPVSPGLLITSNPQPYPLPSRSSMMSIVSSSSSSSGGSVKQVQKDHIEFSLPRGVPKHAKTKLLDNTVLDELTERLKKNFKNVNLLTSTVLKHVHHELASSDLYNGTTIEQSSSDNTLKRFTSSTPEKVHPTALPAVKSTKKGRVTKRTRSQNSKSTKTNGLAQLSTPIRPKMVEEEEDKDEKNAKEINDGESTAMLRNVTVSTPTRQSSRSMNSVRAQTPQDIITNDTDLVGKSCFARWTDKNYYPGVISGWTRNKLKVNFLDGKSKLLIQDFVVLSPEILHPGLSVYAATEGDNYGSCGLITAVDDKNEKKVIYTIQTDDNEKISVPIEEIFLTEDQVNVLREDAIKGMNIRPTTPQTTKISLDNIMEGSRRNKKSALLTPKSTSVQRTSSIKKEDFDAKPSSSGLPTKISFDQLESDDTTESPVDDTEFGGVHEEIGGTSSEHISKGPQSRIKGKARSKKKIEDPETIELVGPIPPDDSTLFKGMNFVLTCGQLESLDKYKAEYKSDTNSEIGTEYEEEWVARPFIRERLIAQIIAGGGKVYDNFNELPQEEYKNTKLITNVPNATERSLLCLSAGIETYNHNWIIRCCKENKILNKGAEVLPAGWSVEKRAYVEFHQRKSNKPFEFAVIVIPKIPSAEKSIMLWKKIIENGGGKVEVVSEISKELCTQATAVLTNKKCPSWIVTEANRWTIPMVSTTWIVQCLIEGQALPFE